MAKRLSTQQQTLYQVLDNILWSEWDPIGVNTVPEARDEYYGYLLPLMDLLILGADERTISSFLYQCETRNLGIQGSKKHCDEIAKKIHGKSKNILNYQYTMRYIN